MPHDHTSVDEILPEKNDEAKYHGFRGPLFANGIEDLERSHEMARRNTPKWIDTAASQVCRFALKRKLTFPTTSDHFVWDRGYIFVLPDDGEALILFAGQGENGLSLRHCALYVRFVDAHASDEAVLESLVYEFGRAIDD